jgi:hypothetical protein
MVGSRWMLVLAGGVLATLPSLCAATLLSVRRDGRSLQQTNLVNVGITLRTVAGPLSNETRVVLEAETSSFIYSSILDQEADNTQLTNLFVDTQLAAQQLVSSGGGGAVQQAQADSSSTGSNIGSWQFFFSVTIDFRLPDESDTMGMKWVTEAFNSADERSTYMERLRNKNDPSFAPITDILLVLVDGAAVDLAEPVKTEFVDVVMVLKPISKTLRGTSVSLFESAVSTFIEDYIRVVASEGGSGEPVIDGLYVDANIVRQRLLLPDYLEYDANVTSLLQNESLALEIILDIQVDYRTSQSVGAGALNVTSWVYETLGSEERQANFTSMLKESDDSVFGSVEAVSFKEETALPTQTVKPDPPKAQPVAKDQNLIGIIAGAVMLGVALIGLLLFAYQQYSYKFTHPQKSEPAASGKIQNQVRNSSKTRREEPEVILEAYRDLHLGRQEDISTLGESLGGVTSQKIHKEGNFTRLDL